MDPKGKGMVVNDKESLFNEPRGDKPTDSGSSHKKKDGKKKRRIKRSSTTTAMNPLLHQETTTMTILRQRKRRLIKTIPLIIPAFRTIQMPIYFLFLLENPHFDGEDYSFWSHKMRSHLFSLHPSIWEIVENGMHFDSTDNHVMINEQIHKNA
jgi:hypothetical protein